MTRLLVFIAGMLVVSCDSAPAPVPREAPAAPLNTTEVARRQLPQSITVGGTVQPRAAAVISSRMVAPITSVVVVAGDRVNAGQVLPVLHGRDQDAQARLLV